MNLAKEEDEPEGALEFRVIYASWFDQVSRWVRAMGGPEADREDLVQEVFVVVHRRLPYFDGNNLRGWLYQIARRRVRDFRQLLWVKHLLFGSVSLPDDLADQSASALEILETQRKSATLERLLDKLTESERAALMLFEVEGYSGVQVAELQGVSLNAVWARIYKARKKLKDRLRKADRG